MNQATLYPKVSVVIPCYNHERFVEEAILSVLNQSYPNIELIVIDDGSVDSSVEQIRALNKKYDFTCIVQDNIGLSATLNKALALSTGKYFTTCSSDDFLAPDKIEKQVNFLLSSPDYKLCYTRALIVDESSVIREEESRVFNQNNMDGEVFDDILTFRFHPPVSFLYEKEILVGNGAYQVGCFAEDYYMNLKLAKKYRFGMLGENLYFYRMEYQVPLKNRSRPPIKYEASESHFQTLSLYENENAYKEALANWNYRRFLYFSAFKAYKSYAFKGMMRSLPRCLQLGFWKSLVILLFAWK